MKNITKVVVLALVMIVSHVNTYAQKSEQQTTEKTEKKTTAPKTEKPESGKAA